MHSSKFWVCAYFSTGVSGGGVFKLLKAFNHLFFMLAVDAVDIFLSRPASPSSLLVKSSFCNNYPTLNISN